MNALEIFSSNIGSLAVIPIVIGVVLKLKNTQIDSLKEQNNILKEQTKLLGLLRVSAVEKDFKALRKFYEEQKKKADKAKNELDKTTKELENVKSLDKKQAALVARLFERALLSAYSAPLDMIWDERIDPLARALYSLEGPIGDAWREHWDGERTLREIEKHKKKRYWWKTGTSKT